MHWRWNSCLQPVNYITKKHSKMVKRMSYMRKKHTIEDMASYCGRVTLTERLKADTTRIITCILNPTLNKGCS